MGTDLAVLAVLLIVLFAVVYVCRGVKPFLVAAAVVAAVAVLAHTRRPRRRS